MKDIQQKIETLFREISEIVIGQQEVKRDILVSLLCGGHILLEWAPWLAKTKLVHTFCDAMNLGFKRIQFTPDLLPSDVIGARIYDPEAKQFQVKKGPIFANMILADEINRAPSKVQSALLEAMEEKQVTIWEESYKLDTPFIVLATQNPLEQEGTYELPEAQLDRFVLKTIVSYPSWKEELQMLKETVHRDNYKVQKVLWKKEIEQMQALLDTVEVSDSIYSYICDIAAASRNTNAYPDISYGASPRASLALLKAAKALALIDGRDYVIPEDIKEIAPSVLRHRIILSYDALAEERNTDDLIAQILQDTKIK